MRIRKNQYSYSTARHFATNERNTLKFLQFVAKLLGFVYSKFYDNWLITSKVMSIYVGVKLENRLSVYAHIYENGHIKNAPDAIYKGLLYSRFEKI